MPVSSMTYYPDGSAYAYALPFVISSVTNVGWLSALSPDFPKGSVSDDFKEALRWACCALSTNQMRGFHVCELCERDAPSIECKGAVSSRRILGSSEIWIESGDKIFAAPDLIFHYVTNHSYCPPKDFIEAVVAAFRLRWETARGPTYRHLR